MQVGSQFLENGRKKVFDMKKNKYMYYHEDILNIKEVPKQKDGMNCGVYTLWHLLLQRLKGKEIVDLETLTKNTKLYITSVI